MNAFRKALAFPLTLLAVLNVAFAQSGVQTIRGTVVDKDAQMPLIGATVTVIDLDPVMGAVTDVDGYFKLEGVPVGRRDIEVSYLGYEPLLMRSVMLTSSKELVLQVELTESTINMQEIVVTARHDKSGTLNEMAVVSARSFSVEETSRYAGSFYDPARMAQNFAGVSVGAGEDLFNEIVIRGNSPRGVLWRLEGIDIPNPNHFGAMGNSGGAISMLSSSTLSNSDFYTGAFPAEFGNALSGVFDLRMRNGNNEKPEYAFMIGALGIEAAAEGPFSPRSRASYLVNYRYSTLAALKAVGLNPVGDVLPEYQDLSFKINMPTRKAGTFALFGLGGKNRSYFNPKPDSLVWNGKYDNWGFEETQTVGTVGLSHRLLLSDNSYLHTVVAASSNSNRSEENWLDAADGYRSIEDERTDIRDNTYRATVVYNHKLNARNMIRAGVIFSHFDFDFTHDEDDGEGLKRLFDNHGQTGFFQAFSQWKFRIDDYLTLNTGLHYSLMTLNGNYAVEPRAALQWKLSPKHTLSASLGLHSKLEHIAVYLFEGTLSDGAVRRPAKDLELTKAVHAVLGYDYSFNDNLRLKTELYYQYLYDVPVDASDPTSTRSIINAFDIWDVIGVEKASNDGTGRNYGLDLTIEKFFSNQYYFLVTGSLFDSRYTPIDGKTYNTRFNGNYQLNLLGGKEFKVGRGKNNIFGLNGRFILSGGNRFTPIDLEASREKGSVVYLEDQRFAERAGAYYRMDVGLSYRINKSKVTHSIMLDVQNVTNRLNVFTKYYDEDTQNIETFYQTGLLPVFNYRVEF